MNTTNAGWCADWNRAFRRASNPASSQPGRATVVCKDMDFAEMIRDDAQEGIRIMYVPAWDFVADGWLHARMAIMRGVEDGFSVARAARDGYLTASDAYGRVVAGAPTSPVGFVVVNVSLPLGPGDTIYKSIGDVFAWLCIGLTLVLGLVALLRGRREADTAPAGAEPAHDEADADL